MHHGVVTFQDDFAMRPDDIARAAEERGFESVFYIDHTHIPVRRTTPYPLGGDLPKDYYHNNDLFVAMSYAAAVTKKIKIGSGICLVIERDPITLAKEVASLDFLSGGRVIFGIGGGWNREEMEDHGTNFTTRWKRLRESMEAMKRSGATTRPSTTASSSTSTKCGPGRSPCRSHTRRSYSADTATRPSTA